MSTHPDNEQSSELKAINGLRCPACERLSLFVGEGGYVTCGNLECPNPDYEDALARHTKEAVARAKAEARKAAFDKIFEMAPKGNFEHWTKQMTANWFVALGRLERELSAPQQSKEDK